MTIYINDTTGLNQTLQQMGINAPTDGVNHYYFTVTLAQHPVVLTLIVTFLALFVSMIVFHELGHWLALRVFHPNTQIKFGVWYGQTLPKLWTGNEVQYNQINPQKRVLVYVSGILAGLIPIFMGGFIDKLYLLLIVPYVWSIRGDINLIVKDMKLNKLNRAEKHNE